MASPNPGPGQQVYVKSTQVFCWDRNILKKTLSMSCIFLNVLIATKDLHNFEVSLMSFPSTKPFRTTYSSNKTQRLDKHWFRTNLWKEEFCIEWQNLTSDTNLFQTNIFHIINSFCALLRGLNFTSRYFWDLSAKVISTNLMYYFITSLLERT